jgi:predicted RNase H-like nuclease/ppGpp synthetase/RelA/SpoT-type nucleotidyltranferase
VFHIGVDLAWGLKQPTGIAVLDEAGRLVHVSAVRTDEEVRSTLAPYVDGPCLVAFDAPLVVRNATGNRPAEAALNKDYARFDAGAHPANTGKPELDPPRGASLCAALGLDLNPRSGRERRAIEVYPHPATVALFRLGRTLKYKNKPGRDLDQLRAELLLLVGLLEGLQSAEPALDLSADEWPRLRAAVETATRKSELRVVEDQVDAVVCAYVARFADARPGDTTTYGTVADGYIVTPTLPADLEPTPRGRRGQASLPVLPHLPADPVREYALVHPELVEAGREAVDQVTGILDDAGINYLSITGRTKSVTSFAEKARRTAEGARLYPDPLHDIGDQIGVRVITYVHSDVAAVADLLHDQVVVLDDRDMGRETAQEGRFGYASRHLQVELAGRVVQVQIRTVLQHAWAEFEHDIRYKGTMPDEHARDFDRRFTLAAGLLELADREFSTIRDRLRNEPGSSSGSEVAITAATGDEDPRIEPRELAAFLAGQYADAGWSRTDHYAWISGLLLELGITGLVELGEVLRAGEPDEILERMEYRYPPGAVRRLDDALLAAYGERYVGLSGNAHRRTALTTRLEKLAG